MRIVDPVQIPPGPHSAAHRPPLRYQRMAPRSSIAWSASLGIAMEAGFREHQVAFVTAYADRDDRAFKGSVSELAWRSFAWFVSEPDHIMVLHRGADADRALLSELMRG